MASACLIGKGAKARKSVLTANSPGPGTCDSGRLEWFSAIGSYATAMMRILSGPGLAFDPMRLDRSAGIFLRHELQFRIAGVAQNRIIGRDTTRDFGTVIRPGSQGDPNARDAAASTFQTSPSNAALRGNCMTSKVVCTITLVFVVIPIRERRIRQTTPASAIAAPDRAPLSVTVRVLDEGQRLGRSNCREGMRRAGPERARHAIAVGAKAYLPMAIHRPALSSGRRVKAPNYSGLAPLRHPAAGL